ncbi:MAG: hypothetical protein KDB37_08265 [Ilumatobacter sp.]|nr:hypothetical protein [Ilumatobacter sp.]
MEVDNHVPRPRPHLHGDLHMTVITPSAGSAADLTTSTTTSEFTLEAPQGTRWPVLAITVGVLALVGGMLSMGQTTAEDDPDLDAAVLDLSRWQYHVAFVSLLASAGCLVVLVTALRRWARDRGGDRLAARAIPNALTITATLLVVAACMAGSLALYLPGGVDEGTMWTDGLVSSYMYLDFGALVGWWGAMLAAVCSIALSFGEHKVLPRWLGITTVPLVALPLAVAAITALPGLPGLFMPIWLIVFGAALLRTR